jgi:D-xylose transport system substrate-binding protein
MHIGRMVRPTAGTLPRSNDTDVDGIEQPGPWRNILAFTNRRAYAAALLGAGLVAAACGSSSSGGTTAPSTPAAGGSSSAAAPAASVPDISAASFTQDFSAMAQLKSVAAAGKGNIGVLLPDTVTSARYVEFDAPLLTKAFETAGLTSSQFSVQNAHGDTATQFTDAQSDITNGASVIIVDPINPGVGARIEKYGQQHGAAVIDYDRLTLGGSRSYYISFNNVQVGTLIGKGFEACVKSEKVAKPDFIKMVGDPTDNNATLFAQGYDAVIKPFVSSGKWVQAAAPAGTWDPPTALTEFTQAFTAHSGVNSAIIPNDENAAPIIKYLQNHGVKANTFPITGQDATLIGLQNILSGYQCGTAYKPIFLEAQAAAAVALYVRDKQTPPADLVNGTTPDTQENGKAVPSVLLTPEWVTSANMAATVVKDNSVPAKQICTSAYAAECKAAGIK